MDQNAINELKKAKNLLDNSIISEEEFAKIKTDILGESSLDDENSNVSSVTNAENSFDVTTNDSSNQDSQYALEQTDKSSTLAENNTSNTSQQNPQSSNNNKLYLFALFVVVAIVAVIIWGLNKNSSDNDSTNSDTTPEDTLSINEYEDTQSTYQDNSSSNDYSAEESDNGDYEDDGYDDTYSQSSTYSSTKYVYADSYDGFVNIRSQPSASAVVLGILYNNGEGAEYLGNYGKWYEVSFNGEIGYVDSRYVFIR